MEKIITEGIIKSYLNDFLKNIEVDVVIAGAGPSGIVCGYYLGKNGIKTVIFERHLKVGGGMPGGGMMFNRIIVQEEAMDIIKEFKIKYKKYEKYYVLDAIETISGLTYRTIREGVKIFNLISVEDVVIRENRVNGVVINWTSTQIAKFHVDPLAIISKYVVDATGHDCEICKVVEKKVGGISVKGERSMWAEKGEREIVENTKEVYPGLIVCGMAANAFFGSERMGAVFGGMFLSGKKAAEIIIENKK
ncbi:MAG: sulfide-dependent adenosine diphosphate thiazole synthase [bacterium]|nr:sulfide-dependent adenosine diphosphate thiazole synthase [bacterium]MCX7916718.1 sulfide-dependent adenosine diphosphate thiazole synthase [bacterium]MDW8163999.1 sulfide-dependent adenosine diphosphate thiazole synthase [Candidatus Omnitrophota bacterium]